MKFTRWT